MISKMKKLLLAARTAEREKVIEILRLAEIVHVEPVDPASVKIPLTIGEALNDCFKAINLLSQVTPDCTKEHIATPGTPTRLVEETLTNSRAIHELKEKIIALSRELEEVASWGTLGLDDVAWLKKEGLKIAFFKGAIADAAEIEAEIVSLIKDVDGNGIFAAASRNDVKASDKFTEIPLPEREAGELSDEIQACQRAIADHQQALECLALRREDVEKYYVKLLNRRRFSEVESGVHTADEIVVLTGWCPESSVADLQKSFEEAEVNVGMSFEEPGEEDAPPTRLDNPPVFQSIAPLYDFMGLTPSYNEPDTSGLFLSMLTVFAAFLVADAGYGLVVLLPLALAYRPLVRRGADPNFLKLGMMLFGGATIYGLLTNAWFGESYRLFESHKFDPESKGGSALLQGLCFFIGVLHLTLAHVMKIRRRKIDLSILGEAGWIIFIWAMYGLICQLILGSGFVMPSEWSIPLFKVSLTLILLFTAPSFNIFKSVFAGFLSILQNASAAFSDILSYIRLWAVGLAGGKVAQAFNNIGAMLPPVTLLGMTLPILKLPVWILGHGINIILCIIGILAHGVRLNLLEFSNHLELDWAGRKYDPFREIK